MIFSLLECSGIAEAAVIVFSYAIIFLLATPVHECAHGYMAKLLGDPTAEEHGRLDLNPIKHLDPMGTIALLFFGVGWANPVPVNPRRARKVSMKTAMALTSVAGPLSNFILALIFVIIMKIVIVIFPGNVGVQLSSDLTHYVSDYTIGYIVLALNMIAEINLHLGTFNLIIPIPPSDGSRIMLLFLPTEYYFKIMRYERYIKIIVLVLLYTGVLTTPFRVVSNFIYSGINFITSFIC
ncbi:MAG: site-2 protease family protein [Ruminiclostridium sp.]|nr:site-2 protease family protein [Ruminiclostridium sp.]